MLFKRTSEKSNPVAQEAAGQERERNTALSREKDTNANSQAVRATAGPSVPASRSNQAREQDIADDLVRRVVAAIDEWARVNKLNAMPRHIIFQQALSIMNAVDRNMTSEK